MKKEQIGQADELLMKILVLPGDKIDFKKSGILMIQESKFTDRRLLAEICDDFLEEYEK